MKRYLGIDYGTVRVGLALSDPLCIIATGYKTLSHRGKDLEQLALEIRDIVVEQAVTDIVLGLPKRTDGQIGEKEITVREFSKILQNLLGLPVEFIDERYTTVLAHQYMNTVGVKKHKKRDIVDQVAAEILLHDFLNRQQRLSK